MVCQSSILQVADMDINISNVVYSVILFLVLCCHGSAYTFTTLRKYSCRVFKTLVKKHSLETNTSSQKCLISHIFQGIFSQPHNPLYLNCFPTTIQFKGKSFLNTLQFSSESSSCLLCTLNRPTF